MTPDADASVSGGESPSGLRPSVAPEAMGAGIRIVNDGKGKPQSWEAHFEIEGGGDGNGYWGRVYLCGFGADESAARRDLAAIVKRTIEKIATAIDASVSEGPSPRPAGLVAPESFDAAEEIRTVIERAKEVLAFNGYMPGCVIQADLDGALINLADLSTAAETANAALTRARDEAIREIGVARSLLWYTNTTTWEQQAKGNYRDLCAAQAEVARLSAAANRYQEALAVAVRELRSCRDHFRIVGNGGGVVDVEAKLAEIVALTTPPAGAPAAPPEKP